MKKRERDYKTSMNHLIQQKKRDVLLYNPFKCFGEMKMTKYRLLGMICVLRIELITWLYLD